MASNLEGMASNLTLLTTAKLDHNGREAEAFNWLYECTVHMQIIVTLF